MADQGSDIQAFPGQGPDTTPRFDLVDMRIAKALDARGLGDGGGGGHMDGMTPKDDRLSALENEVHAIKGSMDWAKVAFAMIMAVVMGGFAVLINMNLNMSSTVGGISTKIAEEFRAQRSEQAAQITAISNAVTATKQTPPQVILVPSTNLQQPPKAGKTP